MSDFDLRVVVRRVLDEGGAINSYRECVETVLSQIPPSAFEDALRECLLGYVLKVRTEKANEPVPPRAALAAGQHASSKVQAIGNAWHVFLSQYVNLGDGVQVRLADATAPQIRAYADYLLEVAAGIAGRSTRLARLADAMDAAGVGRARDLPERLGNKAITEFVPTDVLTKRAAVSAS